MRGVGGGARDGVRQLLPRARLQGRAGEGGGAPRDRVEPAPLAERDVILKSGVGRPMRAVHPFGEGQGLRGVGQMRAV